MCRHGTLQMHTAETSEASPPGQKRSIGTPAQDARVVHTRFLANMGKTMDKYDRATRSRMMRAIRDKGTRLEAKAQSLLCAAWGPRWLVPHPTIPGKPDFARPTSGATLLVFVDSCFWHGCKLHLRASKSNQAYWSAKIDRNRRRDAAVNRLLRGKGFVVVRIWEHEFHQPQRLLRKLKRALLSARWRQRQRQSWKSV
jgi:DNA mismatch endonuclease (patch repair protein)